ncbi:M15 family metallopeptidase [Microbacterium sp. Bi128]|uniref:M15 family metallopeptidase n=1 Tax=Microbacterium sp. Bi128 TaxID=2821115 RepID=UPI001D1C463F|nr:M15 family metallopeptidase [Microbacterium sp. Bi128]CAH0258093.1 hypothetical protein SRABI128_03075 [Microbacterium sp. Bi128]
MATVNIDGHDVAIGTARAFEGLRDAFGRAFPGVTLQVDDGLRDIEVQRRLYADYTSGRSPIRAAYPDENAPHIRGVAIDLVDSAADAGVKTAGTERSNWIREHAHEHGFTAAGFEFGEPWHVELDGDPWSEARPGALVIDGVLGYNTIKRWQEVVGTDPDGEIWSPSVLVAEVQRRLNDAGARDASGFSLDVDGVGIESNIGRTVGPFATIEALQAYVGIEPDGVLDADGSDTIRRVQGRLNAGQF